MKVKKINVAECLCRLRDTTKYRAKTAFGFFFSKDSRRDSLTKDEKQDGAIMHKYWDINAIRNGLKSKIKK